MHEYCGEESVVLTHHVETFLQGGAMVLRGAAAIEEECRYLGHLTDGERSLFCLFHAPYAPVHVGGKAIRSVVMVVPGNIRTHIERLMADEHALAERSPTELGGRLQTSMAQEMSIAVYNIGVAIEHGRFLFAVAGFCRYSHRLEGLVVGEAVAGIQEEDIVARGTLYTFVHGKIEAAVGFTLNVHHMSVVVLVGFAFIGFGYGKGVVGGCAVHNDVFYMFIVLHAHTVERGLKDIGCVECYGYNRKGYHI